MPPLPVDFDTVRVHGHYIDLAGTPLSGTVSFNVTAPFLVDAADLIVIMRRQLTATLDENGEFILYLPATDDPDISPTGFTYTVTEQFNGADGRTYSISVPLAARPDGVEIALVVPVVSQAGVVRAQLLSELSDVDLTDLVTGGILVRDSSGKWVAAPPPSATYLPLLGTNADGSIVVGDPAGTTATTGANILLGARVGRLLAAGSYENIGIGHRALEEAGTVSHYNVALGFQAMGTTTGTDNVAIGRSCLGGAEASNADVSYGGGFPVVQDRNVAIGVECIILGTTCVSNVAIGDHAMVSVAGGSYNVALGATVLSANISGNYNVVLGAHAAEFAKGSGNIALGYTAMQNQTTPSYNIAIGHQALKANQTGVQTIAIGENALTASTATGNTAVGSHAGELLTSGAENTAIGDYALNKVTTGSNNVAVGGGAGFALTTTANKNVCIGNVAGNSDGTNSTLATAQCVTLLGYNAQSSVSQAVVLGSAITGERASVAIGCAGSSANFGGGVGALIALNNVDTVPTTNHPSGGILYFQGGALKVRGGSGTVTVLAAA